MRFQGFIGPSYTLQSVNVDCQRCVNLYPEVDELGTGKEHEVAALVPTPGLLLKLTLPNSPVRGLWRASNGTLFAVGGSKFYSISSAWAATELGSLNTSSGPVSMSDNGLQVLIVDGQYGYTWDIGSSAFAQITDPSFNATDQVTFQDGYFIYVKKNSQAFYISGQNLITWDPLDFGTAEGSPDNLVAAVSGNQNLYLFGTQSTEVFYDSGDVDFPFVRTQGAVSGVGCSAVASIATLGGVPYWLGGDDTGTGIIYRMHGYQPERISTPSIESVIRGLTATQVAAARAWTYQQGGHQFYCLNLPGTYSTWCYDVSTGLWHERAYLNLWSLERHRVDCHAVAYGLNVGGDYVNGNIYSIDPTVYSDNGTSVVRERTAPHLSQSLDKIFYSQFQLDMEVGVGLDGSSQGTDPQVMLQWSDDGGHRWSHERWTTAGAIGKRKTRVVWNRLGSARDRVYKVRITDPVKVVLIGAELGLDPGAS